MPASVPDQVIDFSYAVFDRIFSGPFRARIADRLKRDAVVRQVQEAAAAASQSLTRFFVNKQLSKQQVTDILGGLAGLPDLLQLDDVSNPNDAPEALIARKLAALDCPEAVRRAGHEAIFHVALHSTVQVLMHLGPVMAEWQKLSFASTFELPRRVVARLNQISEQLGDMARAGPTGADERFELDYRDYLLQRFHRVEAGTVRMTTNLDVDLYELFVMPQLTQRPTRPEVDKTEAFLNLAAARERFGGRTEGAVEGIPALEQVKAHSRSVIIGAPGAGKSTFLEWLQLKLAGAEEELVMSGRQAIPLLLRVRQLDARALPRGAGLIQAATASKDHATLMPPGWIERQMKDGRVLFMLDGLDETEPELRDRYVIPWLAGICREYPKCRYLVSSRPVGYPPGALRELEFAECDLLDFGDGQILSYAQHWCTAVRLARNEPEAEARREGAADGKRIVKGIKGNLHIRSLARNPLMLSAICLVNYFEGGELPKDRAVLYKLCVEGLLHHWDQRRGIRSEFGLDEKLRACREVAVTMQADDRAEYEAEKVEGVFSEVFGDAAHAGELLEHIRRRAGLLVERRPGVFASRT